MPQKKNQKNTKAGQVRIIGGDWRGRKLDVLDAAGLRPSGDRVRETLFNWLQWDLAGRRCLDLFAGTGALAFEALSRGAAHADLVETAHKVADQLHASTQLLGAQSKVTVHKASWQEFLQSSESTFDVVFVDPPFEHQLHDAVMNHLCRPNSGKPILSDGALIYVEAPAEFSIDQGDLTGLQLLKQKRMGEVALRLYQYAR